MRPVLEFSMRGRLQAVMSTAILAVLATLLAPLSYLSGAVLGLATLRNGPSEGLIVMVGSGVIYGLICALVFQTPLPAFLMLIVTWGPTLVLCAALRASSSQSFALTCGALLASLGVLIFHAIVGDTAAWWRDLFDEVVVHGIQGLKLQAEPQAIARLMEMLDVMAPVMAGLVAAALMFGACLMTLMARWLHAILDNPGGFGREFRELRFDRRLALGVLTIGLLAMFANDLTGGFGREVLCVAIVLYVFQGVAIVHGIVAQLAASAGWLFGFYVLMAIAAEQVLFVLSITGFLDTWLDLRGRVANRGAGT